MNRNKPTIVGEKYRHELKYICSELELEIIERKLRLLMLPDPHADANGEYLIRSVYFDDYRRSRFFENEDGVDPREKFRIRIYNGSDGRISLEKKIKRRGMTGKRSCLIDRETCDRMLAGQPIRDKLGQHPLLDEWILMRDTAMLRPVMLGEYVRKPFVYRLGNVRTESVHNDEVNLIIEVRRVKDSAGLIRALKETQGFHEVSLLVQEGAID